MEAPEFGHMTLIINSETGKKLSKRDTNTLQFIEDYRKKGYLPEAVFNLSPFLVGTLVGKMKSPREELIKLFLMKIVSCKSPAADQKKKWTGWAMGTSRMRILGLSLKWPNHSLEEAGRSDRQGWKITNHKWSRWTKSFHWDLFFSDFPELTDAEKKSWLVKRFRLYLKPSKAKLEAMSDDEFVAENILPQIKAVQKETGIKGKNLCQSVLPFQVKCMVLNCHDTIYLFGRENPSNTLKTCWKKSDNYQKSPIKWGFLFYL